MKELFPSICLVYDMLMISFPFAVFIVAQLHVFYYYTYVRTYQLVCQCNLFKALLRYKYDKWDELVWLLLSSTLSPKYDLPLSKLCVHDKFLCLKITNLISVCVWFLDESDIFSDSLA